MPAASRALFTRFDEILINDHCGDRVIARHRETDASRAHRDRRSAIHADGVRRELIFIELLVEEADARYRCHALLQLYFRAAK